MENDIAFEEHTRAIYHEQHKRQEKDEITRNRLMSLTTEAFFQVLPGFFNGKIVLDAGCGSIARNAIGFHKMGAQKVTALDIGDEWFNTAKKNMVRYDVPDHSIELVAGSVTASLTLFVVMVFCPIYPV